MKFWLPILTIALGTYLYRCSFIGGGLKSKMPDLIKRGLEFVPVSVLAALVAAVFFLDARKFFTLHVTSPAAAACVTIVALRFGRDLLTSIAGLTASYWCVEWLLA